MSCPSLETLLAYAAADLSPAASARVESHMNTGCQSCNRRFEEVSALRRLASHEVLPDVPSWISRRAVGIAGESTPPGELAYLVAALVHDTFRDPLPLGARAAPADARHMLFSAGEFDLSVRITPAGPGRVRVVGQALPPDDGEPLTVADSEVVLASRDGGYVAQSVDEHGGFVFDDLVEGDYELTVAAPGYRFVVPHLSAVPKRIEG